MTALKYKVEQARRLLKNALTEIEDAPELSAIIDLLAACEVIDERYQDFCADFDRDDGDEIGTLYNSYGGISIEYYIEADWWHDVSRALRALRKTDETR